MRTRVFVVAALCLSMALPVVGAVPSLLQSPANEAGPSPAKGEVEQLQDIANAATGQPAPSSPVNPIVSPGSSLEFGGGAAFGALALMGLGAAAVGFALFQGGARFVTPAEVLQNDVRQQMFAYLKRTVGANLKQLTDDLGLTTTNAIWHLRKLEEAGLIHSRRFNGYKVFYPAEGGVEARRMSLGRTALQNENAQEVFEHVVGNPGTHQREIARALGVNHGTVRWHLKKLLSAELITETRQGKASAYVPTEIGLQALRDVGPRPTTPSPIMDVSTAA